MGGKVGSGSDWGPGERDTRAFWFQNRGTGVGIALLGGIVW